MKVQPTDLPAGHRRTVLVTGINTTLPIGAVLVDQDGDTWSVTGRTPEGEPLLACDQPLDPADQGEGPSFPWTLSKVDRWFGPLVPKAALQAVAA